MKHRAVIISVLGLCLAVSGSLQAQDSSPMQEIVDQWQTHHNNGDYEAVASLYTANAVRHPPASPTVSGYDAILTFLQANAGATVELAFGGSEMAGNMLSSWGTYEIYSESADGTGLVQSGPWMNIAKKGEDGTWKITRDIWNRQQP